METPANPPVEPTKKYKSLWRFLRLPIFVYAGLCVVMVILEPQLVYPRPASPPSSSWKITQEAQTDVSFQAADGTKLHGWFFEHEQPQCVILYCHGNGENVSHNAGYMDQLRRQLQASIFIFDYRGYGKSEGSPNEAGVLEDGLAAQCWLAEKVQVETEDVVLMGRSLGGGVAVALAAKQGARALVLQNTFANMSEVAADKFPWLPVRWIMRNQYPSAERIRAYDGPLLQTHGTRDRIVPYAQGQKLFAAAPSATKQWIENKDFGHNEPLPTSYMETLAQFLTTLPK